MNRLELKTRLHPAGYKKGVGKATVIISSILVVSRLSSDYFFEHGRERTR
jgi:hypothetical protein